MTDSLLQLVPTAPDNIYLRLYVIYWGVHMPQRSGGGQKTTFGSWRSPSAAWVSGVELGPSGSIARALASGVIALTSTGQSLLNRRESRRILLRLPRKSKEHVP